MVCFSIAEGIHVPRSLHRALVLAEEVLRSDQYLNEFLDAVPDASKASIVKCLDEGGIKVDMISNWSEMKRYATAGAEVHPGVIKFNPILLAEMLKREYAADNDGINNRTCSRSDDGETASKMARICSIESTEVYSKHVYLLMVKAVSACSHVMRWLCSPSFATSAKYKRGELRIVAPIDSKVINGHTFDDVGDILECTLFGGITQHSEHIHYSAFGIDELVLLPFARDPKPKFPMYHDFPPVAGCYYMDPKPKRTAYRVDPTTIGGSYTDIKINILTKKVTQSAFFCRRGREVVILRPARARRVYASSASKITRTEVGVDSSDAYSSYESSEGESEDESEEEEEEEVAELGK